MSAVEVGETRPAGVWREDYRMPDGSRPVKAIDADGVCRATYYMQPGDDPAAVHEHLAAMLGQPARSRRRTNLELVD